MRAELLFERRRRVKQNFNLPITTTNATRGKQLLVDNTLGSWAHAKMKTEHGHVRRRRTAILASVQLAWPPAASASAW
jgi:hypothetical protein